MVILILASMIYHLAIPQTTLIDQIVAEVFFTEGASMGAVTPERKLRLPTKIQDDQEVTLEEDDVLDLIHRLESKIRPSHSMMKILCAVPEMIK